MDAQPVTVDNLDDLENVEKNKDKPFPLDILLGLSYWCLLVVFVGLSLVCMKVTLLETATIAQLSGFAVSMAGYKCIFRQFESSTWAVLTRGGFDTLQSYEQSTVSIETLTAHAVLVLNNLHQQKSKIIVRY